MRSKLLFILIIAFSLILIGCAQDNNNSEGATNNEDAETESDFPEKPIEIVVPYAPGGTADIIARIMADGLSKHLPNDASVAVINTDGGSGTVGMTEVYNANSDGYKIAFTPFSTLTIQPHFGNTIYSYDDFDPLTRVVYNPNVLVVKSGSQWNNFEEWKEFVQENPGEFVFSIGNPGGETHLILENLMKSVDAEATIVPTNGDAEVVSNVLGGHADGAVVMPVAADAQLESGDFKSLLNLTEQDLSEIIDGIDSNLPNFNDENIEISTGGISLGFFGPKGLPEDVHEILTTALKEALEDEEVIEKIENTKNVISYAGPEEVADIVQESFNEYEDTVKELDLSN